MAEWIVATFSSPNLWRELMIRNKTLEAWEREESDVRARLAGPGPLLRDEIIALSGLEIFQGIFDGRFPSPPIGDTLDFIPIQIALGFAIFQGRPQPKHYNPLSTGSDGFARFLTRRWVAQSTRRCSQIRATPPWS